jgi:hypothetical protein
MKKKQFLTESDRKQILADKEKAILESFTKTFNKIKRVDEAEITEDNESTVLTSTDKSDLKQDIAKLKKEKPDAKVGEITKNGKIFSVRITF